MKVYLLLVALYIALSSLASAGTITVGPFGAGADYFHIVDAVNAAQPGDVILVSAGHYEHSSPIRIDKPLTILGEGSNVTSFTLHAGTLGKTGVPLTIENLALD